MTAEVSYYYSILFSHNLINYIYMLKFYSLTFFLQARRELGAKWKNLPAEEKAQFLKQTEAQKEQYKLQLEEYKKERADEETKVKVGMFIKCMLQF